MIIKCSKCPAKFKIHDDKIKSTGFSFKCTKCGQVNVVKKPSAPTKKEVLRLINSIKPKLGNVKNYTLEDLLDLLKP